MPDEKPRVTRSTIDVQAADDVAGYQVVGDATGGLTNTIVSFFSLGAKYVLIIEEPRSDGSVDQRPGPIRSRG